MDIIIVTRLGKIIRFRDDDLREMGRNASGVRGIMLGANDEVVSVVEADPVKSQYLVTVTKEGKIKKTSVDECREQSRGGKGITGMVVHGGDIVVSATIVND